MTQPEKQEAPTGSGRGQTIFLSHFKRDSELNKNLIFDSGSSNEAIKFRRGNFREIDLEYFLLHFVMEATECVLFRNYPAGRLQSTVDLW